MDRLVCYHSHSFNMEWREVIIKCFVFNEDTIEFRHYFQNRGDWYWYKPKNFEHYAEEYRDKMQKVGKSYRCTGGRVAWELHKAVSRNELENCQLDNSYATLFVSATKTWVVIEEWEKLGVHYNFIHDFMLPKARQNKDITLDALNKELSLYFKDTKLRFKFIFSEDLEYFSVDVYTGYATKKSIVSFMKQNKKTVDKFLVRAFYDNSVVKAKNLKLNWYKLTNIMVSNDARLEYLFNLKVSETVDNVV